MIYNKNLSTINIYDSKGNPVASRELEDLVKEMIASTISLTLHMEVIKCQSIIVRTNIFKKLKNIQDPETGSIKKGINLDDIREWRPIDTYIDVWGHRHKKHMDIINVAVEATAGQIIVFSEKPIDARYHEICGGSTENSENVDGNIVAYLRRVLCQYCCNAPAYENHKDISLKEIESALGVKFIEVEATNSVPIENFIYDIIRDESGRVVRLKIAGKEFEGKEVKRLLKLDSTKFSWKPQSIRFLTVGKGDGIGFCQYGGDEMAKQGKSLEDIIKYYYTGVEIKKILNPSINKPLLGKVLVIDPAHGGNQGDDHTSPKGLKEKEINLEIAFHLEEILTELGANVRLTRRQDHYVPIIERAKLVNEIKPNFLLTLHQNYLKNSNVSGTEIYYYRGDQEAYILGQLIMEKMTEKLATLNRGVRTAEFYLLRDIKVSGLHIEVAYLSNIADEEKLMQAEFKRLVAVAIGEALVSYFN